MKEVYGVGIIGAGKFSLRHIRAMEHNPRISLIAACRTRKKPLQALCTQHGLEGFLDYAKMIADPRIDIVLIATPHHLHSEMTIAAARAGKHILLEKPFAVNLSEARLMEKAIQKYDVKLLLGHVIQFSAAYQTASAYLKTGTIGFHCTSVRGQPYFLDGGRSQRMASQAANRWGIPIDPRSAPIGSAHYICYPPG